VSWGGEESLLYKPFKWHYLNDADFKLVSRRLGRPLNDRNTFHDFYRIDERLGQAFKNTEPCGLYPIDEYFGGRVKGAVTSCRLAEVKRARLQMPLKPR